MRILSVVGARPQFVKLAPVAAAVSAAGVEHVVVHTGQHYDEQMSQSFFDTLRIPAPDVNLGIGSDSHGAQTGSMLVGLEPVFERYAPDWVLVYGDTNSTIASALCAVKLHLPLAHLEAGLRSFNRRMPEEHNRVLTDHAADLCLAPTEVAVGHLTREGLGARTVLVGDVMTDVVLRVAQAVAAQPVDSPVPVDETGYALATLHRPDNTDDPERLGEIVAALARLDRQVYLAAHPRLVARAEASGLRLDAGAITVVPPLAYPQLVQALGRAGAVVTDSGGLQKEAFLMGVPTTTVRTETEWVETLDDGWNVLAPDPTAIEGAVGRPTPTTPRSAPYGDGTAAVRTVETLQTWAGPVAPDSSS
jgi:UDP-N-acetylglucosamine 2-epimerase (non-hydrolysing)